MFKILHNPHCSKSNCALDFLKEKNLDFELQDYKKHPLSKEELRTLCDQLKLPPEAIVRKNEKLYREKFAQMQYTDEEWLDILAKYPELLQRPIVILGDKAVVARPAEEIDTLL